MLAVLVAGGLYFRSHRSTKLSEKDAVLLTDFVNTTGDSVFDGTLKQALATQLEQSPYFNILPESRIREALRFMGRPEDQRVTSEVAREICARENAKAMLTGSIASLGSHYVISLAAVNAETGDSIASEQAESESKEQVIKSLDKAATSLRSKLGESLPSVKSSLPRSSRPLPRRSRPSRPTASATRLTSISTTMAPYLPTRKPSNWIRTSPSPGPNWEWLPGIPARTGTWKTPSKRRSS